MQKLFLTIIISALCLSLFSQETEAFMPKIMEQFPNVRDISISPQGDEIYFTIQSFKKEYSAIAYIKKVNNNWSEVKIASFSGQYTDIEPFLAHNGLKLYFASNRPKSSNSKFADDFDIWVSERKTVNDDWMPATNLGQPINTNKNEFYPSVAANGNIYFTASYESSKGKEDIYISEYINNEYQEPTSLSEAINTDGWEFNAFIAPDELYIIFTSTKHENNLGGGDLYICYKNKNNEWTKAENMGIEINSPKIDFCPYVDLKTNTLYFSSEKSLISKHFEGKQSVNELLNTFNTAPNGLCRIYSIPFEIAIK